jgi:hypothetical protein
LINSGIQYLGEVFAATGNSFPLAISEFDSFSRYSGTDGLQKSGSNRTKVLATYLRKMLIGDGKDEKMRNIILG